jgi:hypothetical protein
MTRQDLKTLSNNNVADAPPLNISALGLRELNDEVTQSCASILDDNTFTAISIFDNEVICNKEVYTGYQLAISPNGTMDIVNVLGNYLEISGSFDTINSFGDCSGGEIRFLKFYDPCQISNNGVIEVPTGQLINVESGDTCIMIGNPGQLWTMVAYQRYSGLPLSSSVVQSWTMNPAAPTLNESNPPYSLGYRWVSQESGTRRKEWISDYDQSSAAVWNPMAGSFGQWGDGTTLEIDSIIPGFFGLPTMINNNIRYTRISNMITISGYIEVQEIDGNNGWVMFNYANNNQGINFEGTTAIGYGTLTQNGQPLSNDSYRIYALNSEKLYVDVVNAWASDTIGITFRMTVFLQ